MWDKEAAIAHLNTKARSHSVNRCAKFVRQAIEAGGGVRLPLKNSAKDYGSSLRAAGFTAITNANTIPVAGDVVVIQPIPGHPHGHMAMFNGKIWVSDFKQRHGYYPGESYRRLRPPAAIYRKTN